MVVVSWIGLRRHIELFIVSNELISKEKGFGYDWTGCDRLLGRRRTRFGCWRRSGWTVCNWIRRGLKCWFRRRLLTFFICWFLGGDALGSGVACFVGSDVGFLEGDVLGSGVGCFGGVALGSTPKEENVQLEKLNGDAVGVFEGEELVEEVGELVGCELMGEMRHEK